MARIPFQFSDRLASLALSRHRQWLVCILLAVLCALAALRLGALLLTDAAMPQVRFPQAAGGQPPTRIALFPEAATTAARENLTESTFDGSLVGVMHLDGRSLASIAVKRGKEKVYRVGDELSPGVTVEQIETHRVVVRERGVLKQISLKSLLDSSAPIQVGETTAMMEEAPDSTAFGAAAAGAIKATPLIGEDGVSGLRLDQLTPQLEARDLVYRGDLVVAVDGVGLGALMADSSAIAELLEREAVTLTVIRNGNETTVDIGGDLIRALLNDN